MLEVRDLRGGYARSPVLEGVNARVGAGEVVAILGRNGTGKTSLLRALMGLLPWSEGSVALDERLLDGLPTHLRARRGLGYVPQGRDIFPGVSLEQNLRYGLVLAGRRMRDPLPQHVFEMFPWMSERLGQRGGTLSGGEQQMLAIARVLVGEPKVLLLDEPTEGLAPTMVQHVGNVIGDLRDQGALAIVLVEQNLAFALALASRGYVLEKGRIVAEGDSGHLQQEEVIARHLSI
jgi:branched-chain amino acid transport system ATP-binding protein